MHEHDDRTQCQERKPDEDQKRTKASREKLLVITPGPKRAEDDVIADDTDLLMIMKKKVVIMVMMLMMMINANTVSSRWLQHSLANSSSSCFHNSADSTSI